MTTNITAISTPAHIETLNLAQEQMQWLQSLFSAIKNDELGHDAKNLSALGCFLTDMWRDNYLVMLENTDGKNGVN
jgi:hypothetical protein